MSSWKKASKVNQKTHRERHQPESRSSLGLLEKKKDYVRRARDFNEKKTAIRKLKEIACNRNPDEFYFHMINSKLVNGRHTDVKNEKEMEETEEQAKLMANRSLQYVEMMKTIETKKIDKLQSMFHLIDISEKFPRQHIHFDQEAGPSNHSIDPAKIQNFSSSVDFLENATFQSLTRSQLAAVKRKKKKIYSDIAKRIGREKELKVVTRKMEMHRILKKHKGLKPKLIKAASKTEAPQYEFKYERKR